MKILIIIFFFLSLNIVLIPFALGQGETGVPFRRPRRVA